MGIEWIEKAADVQRVKDSIVTLFNESTLEEGMIGYARELTAAEAIEIVVDFRIVDVSRLMQTDVVHDALSDPAFELRREIGPRRLAEIGQIVGQRQASAAKHNGDRQRQGLARDFERDTQGVFRDR